MGEAVEAGAHIEAIYYAPELLTSQFAQDLIDRQSAHGLPCYAVAADIFDVLVEKENPQGILGVVHQRYLPLSGLGPRDFPWGVALVEPQDPGNVGTIFRTIDAVGASGLILLENSVDPYHATAVRASMGALFWHPVVTASFVEFAGWARENRYHIYGTSAHAERDYREVGVYRRPLVLLMGSEREGLSDEQAAICEQLVRLPMKGKVTSLNLAVATGVMLYEMLGSLERGDD